MARREAESLRLRSERERLEGQIVQADREKEQLMKQITSQPPASMDEEIWQFYSNDGSWDPFPPRANEVLKERFYNHHTTCEVKIGGSTYDSWNV